MNNDGAVDNPQRFAHIMVGNQHAQPTFGEFGDERTNFADSNRIDTGETPGKMKLGLLASAPISTRRRSPPDRASRACRHRPDGEVVHQLFNALGANIG